MIIDRFSQYLARKKPIMWLEDDYEVVEKRMELYRLRVRQSFAKQYDVPVDEVDDYLYTTKEQKLYQRYLYIKRFREKRIVSRKQPLSEAAREAISGALKEDLHRIFEKSINPELQDQPKVSIIVPLRNAKKENVLKLMNALSTHNYLNYEVILVGGKDDKTWQHLTEEHLAFAGFSEDAQWEEIPEGKLNEYSPNAAAIRLKRGARLTIVEVTLGPTWDWWKKKWTEWKGRDTNVKRNVGCRLATGDIFALTDGKITYPQGYLLKAVAMLKFSGAGAVAGEVKGREEDKDNWIDVFGSPGGSFIRRFPTFGKTYLLDQESIKGTRTLPVTASWVMTRAAYLLMEGFDERATTSYEDFMSCVKYIENGGTFYLVNHDDFKVEHGTRKVFGDLIREWRRSGTGAEDTWEYYPNSPFSKKRLHEVQAVLGASTVAFFGSLSLIAAGLGIAVAAIAALILVVLFFAGLYNAHTAKKWYGFVFPELTAFLIFLFAVSFGWQYLFRDGAERLLMMIWQFQWEF